MSNSNQPLTLAFRETGELCRPPEESEEGRTVVRLVQSVLPAGCTAERDGGKILIVLPDSETSSSIVQSVRHRLDGLSFAGTVIGLSEIDGNGDGEKEKNS